MPFTVRRLQPTDWQELREIRLAALRDTPLAFGSSFAEEVDRPAGWWKTSIEGLAWFAGFDGQSPVGLIAGLPAADEAVAVISMWVAPDQRGSGLARTLFAAVSDWARSTGARSMVLNVSDGNERARRFYEKLGFAPTGAGEPLRSHPDIMSFEMRLELPAP